MGVTDIFDALGDGASAPSPASTSSIQSFTRQIGAVEEPEAAQQAQEDGPPLPSADSYPPGVNPAAAANEAVARARAGLKKPVYAVSVKATRNNTIVTFARPKGAQLVTLTGGKLGFKKSNRNGYEAGYQCAVGIIGAMEKELERTAFEWELNLKGFGQGRDAMLTAITTAVGERVKPLLTRVTDRTPLKIGGTRGQKARRI
ncbi:translational machinery component [Trametes versicolor FP-101664 SS1]|uniref:translational machinery component n=1 Tax=Trametes versicolor (strain FP-101664) TaxID=717944 RepID=UPI0004622EEE|nr:translational machinery component [Trametes versicolor FP-101664 SS1]EIW61886.1 translational machinery component [Trametes versicolor FP-101664 SS1]